MSLVAFALAGVLWFHPEAPDQDRLAVAIATAAEEAPLFDDDVDGRRTAALLVVTAWEESRFDRFAVGDSGRSCGLFGIWVGRSERRCRAIQEDVFGSARIARDMLRESLRVCRARPVAERLGLYLGGSCGRGLPLSRRRWWLMKRLVAGEGRADR